MRPPDTCQLYHLSDKMSFLIPILEFVAHFCCVLSWDDIRIHLAFIIWECSLYFKELHNVYSQLCSGTEYPVGRKSNSGCQQTAVLWYSWCTIIWVICIKLYNLNSYTFWYKIFFIEMQNVNSMDLLSLYRNVYKNRFHLGRIGTYCGRREKQ